MRSPDIHHSQGVAPSRCNWGKPTYRNRDHSTAKIKHIYAENHPELLVLINIQIVKVRFFRSLALIYLLFLVLWRRKW